MAEYLKHPNMVNEKEIKIGVCYGDRWEVYLAHRNLIELKKLGFKDWYAGKFSGDTEKLDEFLERYDTLGTSYVLFKEFAQVEVVNAELFPFLKQRLLEEGVALVLYKDNENILVTDMALMPAVARIAKEARIKGVRFREYHYTR